MTSEEFASYIRFLTKTDTTTFTDADILALANLGIDDISAEIIKVNEDYFAVPATTDLVADQREYPFPDEMLSSMKRVEAAFEVADPLVFIRLKETDLTKYKKGMDEATIITEFSNDEGIASFDIIRKAIYILSGTIIDVTSGLKLWYTQYPAHLSDLTGSTDISVDPSTTTAGFPRQFHELLGRWVSIRFKGSKEVPIPLTEIEMNYKIDLQEKLNSVKLMNLDREVKGTIPYEDGSNF
jgi:hypothetical protein